MHIKSYFMAKNSFVAEVTFKRKYKKMQENAKKWLKRQNRNLATIPHFRTFFFFLFVFVFFVFYRKIFRTDDETILSGLYLVFACNFMFFLQMPYFEHQVTIWGLKCPANSCKWVAFAVGVQKKPKHCKALKVARGPKFHSNNHSIWDVFPTELRSNIYAM